MKTSRWACVLVVGLAAVSAGCSDDEPLKEDSSNTGQAGDDGAEPDAGSDDDTNGGMTTGGNSNDVSGGAGGSAGAGGAVSGGAGNVATPDDGLVGDYCDADEDCSHGMTCLLESTPFFSEGTIAGGFCTSTCDAHAQCLALDNRSNCLTFNNGTPEDGTDDSSYCIDVCSVGVEGNCDARADRYCQRLEEASNAGVCLPRCFGHSSCPDGVCDGVTGACMEEERPGQSLGETCAEHEDCSGGICYFSEPEGGTGVCTELCVMAPLRGACGQPPDGDAPPEFLCLPDIGTLLAGTQVANLDLGVCTGTCDEDADCGHDGFICRPFATEEAVAEVGKNGVCLQAVAFEEGMGGAGGMGTGGAETGGSGGTGGAPQADAGAP